MRFFDIINKVFFGTQLTKYLLDSFVEVHIPNNKEYNIDQIQKLIELNDFNSMSLIKYK